MNILNYLKSSTAPIGIGLSLGLLWTRAAAAEVKLVERDGWTFYTEGRIGSFVSLGFGDDFPLPTPNPGNTASQHEVMGRSGGEEAGTLDAGWPSSYQQNADNEYLATRIRSGMLSNILAFGLQRNLSPDTVIKGYLAIWATIETPGRDKWIPVDPEAREAFIEIKGPWGTATAGRTFAFFGRTSAEIDYQYGHTYGLGLPCSDYVGPGCGHIGTGVAFPGYSAGIAYSTPSLAGLQLHAGLYDPVAYNRGWPHAPYPRPEGAVTFEVPLGNAGMLRLAAEGLYQPLSRTEADPNSMSMGKRDVSTSLWGVSGGARLEVGPVRLGVSGFRGRGIGLHYALQGSPERGVSFDEVTHELRMFTGVYGQAALMLGDLHLAAGGGAASVDQLRSDLTNIELSVIQRQVGISAAAYYHLSDSVVVSLDYFRYMARWYGAPRSVLDAGGTPVIAQGLLPGEKQDLNFINAGVTYHW